MNNIENKYSDSIEYQRDLLRTAINTKFQDDIKGYSPYDIKATYSDKGMVVVLDWDKNQYFEIPYSIKDNEVTLGDPKITEHDEMFITQEQINNSMKQGQPFILLNTNEENPVYRVLVQTPEELPAQDMGYNSVKYGEDGIKGAIDGLLGEYVYDKSQSNHGKFRDGTATEKKFAQIVNTGYCPQYGGFTDWEVFDKDYVPLIEQALNSRMKGLPVKEGPSTEIKPIAGEKDDNGKLTLTEWEYNGIVWDKNPRDINTGVCSVVLNSLPNKIGGDKVTDGEFVNINKTEYDELTQAKSELDELKAKHEKLETDYTNGKKLYKEVKEDRDDMFKQMVPVWTKQGELKEQMVNSILERVPEAEQKDMKAKLEKKDFSELEDMMILNSIEMPTGTDGVTGGGAPPGNPTKDMTDLEKRTAAALERRGQRKGIVKR
ncbi:hypothetical protein [Methanobacterium sp.]|uniref:hypothetical protein n=1 Tax=Methanobacterium sp. TaxID=2164 RepID=UPI003C70F306